MKTNSSLCKASLSSATMVASPQFHSTQANRADNNIQSAQMGQPRFLRSMPTTKMMDSTTTTVNNNNNIKKPTMRNALLALTSLALLNNNLATATNPDTSRTTVPRIRRTQTQSRTQTQRQTQQIPASATCTEDQATLVFTLNTDAGSKEDNSWHFTHALTGETMQSGSVESDDAVVNQILCVDAYNANSVLTTSESFAQGSATAPIQAASSPSLCYDLELHDEFGDGLTLPHSDAGGTPGGWTLQWNGEIVAEHNPPACLLQGVKGKFNGCAEKFGFEYCGVRVCSSTNGGVTVSNLKGSECSLEKRTCVNDNVVGSIDPVTGASVAILGTATVSVEINTDSYAEEFSWELRQSFKSNAYETSGELLMAGGKPLYYDEVVSGDHGGEEDYHVVIVGQEGVGVELDDNERFTSTSCQDDSQNYEECYDFRAYDVYGDGLGCGDDGSIAITIDRGDGGTTGASSFSSSIVSLLQKDDNFATASRAVDSSSKLACMNQAGLKKWSYCAIRICNDGDVIRLPGNQCSFGSEVLLDPDADGEIQPSDALLSHLTEENSSPIVPQLDEEDPLTKAEIFAAEDNPTYLSLELNSQSITANAADGDETFAEYYEGLSPLGYDVQEVKPNKQDSGKNDSKNNNPKVDNFQGIAPIKPASTELKPQSVQFSEEQYTVHLEPFYATLLSIDSPAHLFYNRPQSLSKAIPPYLMNFLDVNIEGWKDDNAPSGFDLICTKTKQNFGSQKRWVMKCEGEALFNSNPLPKKALMNDLVHQAFAGEFHEDFLRFMYPTYVKEDGKNLQKQQMKQQLKEQKQEMEQQMQEMAGNGLVHDEDDEEEEAGVRNPKKQQMKQKLQQQKLENQAKKLALQQKRQRKKEKKEQRQELRKKEKKDGRRLRVRSSAQ